MKSYPNEVPVKVCWSTQCCPYVRRGVKAYIHKVDAHTRIPQQNGTLTFKNENYVAVIASCSVSVNDHVTKTAILSENEPVQDTPMQYHFVPTPRARRLFFTALSDLPFSRLCHSDSRLSGFRGSATLTATLLTLMIKFYCQHIMCPQNEHFLCFFRISGDKSGHSRVSYSYATFKLFCSVFVRPGRWGCGGGGWVGVGGVGEQLTQ